MFEHGFKVMRIGSERLHVGFVEGVLQYFPQDLKLFRTEFYRLHRLSPLVPRRQSVRPLFLIYGRFGRCQRPLCGGLLAFPVIFDYE